ncbi:probable LRR receptor-like serine/threonine-protein kinase At1g06840 [Corylus avellana]|uniref:probable LRR receptor-like serine/threonine-protein kinase At1g06840 n=1 Tax=Corylus avellana TaxID=13451 RepID=UPI00286AC60A|nr:probable LRR receptor-like serine/threonine-protein kinase At1g06840 [Corylus avellana]
MIKRFYTKYLKIWKYEWEDRQHNVSKASMKIDGVKDFTYGEMALATNNFNISTQVGQGGYGKVYKGILANGTVVATQRAQEGSLQGEKEFLEEIELLSRLHHRNLVSLIGYCDEEGEQEVASIKTKDYECCKSKKIADVIRHIKADPMVADVVKVMTPPSSSSNVKHPYVSKDLSGSNLDSGVVPTITPR